MFDAETRELTARTMIGATYRAIPFGDIEKVEVEKDPDKPWYRIALHLRGGEIFYPSRRWYDREDRLPEVLQAIKTILRTPAKTRGRH